MAISNGNLFEEMSEYSIGFFGNIYVLQISCHY